MVDEYIPGYVKHEDMWMRRISLIFQLKYKHDLDQDLMFKNIKALWHEDDFFIRKAIGWILREHSKYDTKAVIDFVKENEDHLSHLSKVEAMKYLHKHSKTKYKKFDIPQYVGQKRNQ